MIYFRIDLAGKSIAGRPAAEAMAEALVGRDPPFAITGTTLEISAPAGTLVDYLVTGTLTLLGETDVVMPDIRVRDFSHWFDAYATPAYKKKLFDDDLTENAREALRDIEYQNAPDTSGDQHFFPPDDRSQKQRTSALLAGVLDNHGGLCMARSHGDYSSISGLTELVEQGAVDILFLEEFTIEEQGLIDDYLNGDDEDLSPPLQAKIEVLNLLMVRWEPILKAARTNGIKIYAIDSSEARDIGVSDFMGTEAFGEQRDAQMNKVVHDVMTQALNDPANQDLRYLSVVGAAHANTHRGGIPGVSQMFAIPSLTVSPEGDLGFLKEKTALRGMPSRDEAAFIDIEIMRKYASGECTRPEDHGARKAATKQAELLKDAGALPTCEETLLMRRYIEKANAVIDPAPDPEQLRLAALRKIDDDKVAAKARFDALNRDTIVEFDRLLKSNPPNADALREMHDQARVLAGKNGLTDLLGAVSLMEFIEATLANTAGPAPIPVDLSARIAAADAATINADIAGAVTAIGLFDDLKAAIAQDDAGEVTRLLQVDPTLIKLTDENGRSIIHLAAKDEKTPILLAISAACPDANFNLPDAKGDAPIHLALGPRRVDRETDDPAAVTAAMKSQDDALAALLAAGANVDARNAKGATALHLTSTNYNTDVLERLFDAGADVTITDDRGWTPLQTSMGATSTIIEQTYFDKGKAARTALCADDNQKTTIDLLCEATLCENPKHAAKIRTAYEQAFANPEMRPLLELVALDAAMPRTPPDSGTRMFVADGATADTLIQRKVGQPAMGYRGGYDKHAGVVHVSGDTQGADFAGVLMHELTHRATQIVCGDRVLPFAEGDDLAKSAYVDAIEHDIKNMHLLSPSSPMETEVKRCIMGRMDAYANAFGEDGGDPALLQEFIVSIPQLIASYGSDAVRNMAPELYSLFCGFTEMCQGEALDNRFNAVRGGVDDSAVVVAERDYLRAPADSWIGNAVPEMGVDALINTMKTEYAIRHGEPDPAKARDAMDGPVQVNAVTIKYDVSAYRIPPAQQGTVNAKFDAVKVALEKALAQDLLTLPLSPDDYKNLIRDITATAQATDAHDIAKAVEKQAALWLAGAKKRYLDNKFASGEILTDQEIAETVALAAEQAAASDVDEYSIDTKKHLSIVAKLTEFLSGMDAGKKNSMELQKTFIERAVGRMVAGDKSAVRIKTGRKMFGTRDPSLVSIDVSKAKSAWVKAARSMV